jgi:alcohol dehydrogenase class IV
MRSVWLLPRLALVDPELTLSLPPPITAATGLDALTQLIEPYVGLRANPVTDAFCVEGIRRVARSLRRAWEHGRDMGAREDMALASLLGGLALANAGLGAVHGFAGPLGGLFRAPHGAVCAALLPHVIRANVRAIEQREPNHPARARFDDLGRLLTGRAQGGATDAVDWVLDLSRELGIPPLREYGIGWHDVAGLVEKAARASSMKGNPLVLSPEELTGIVQDAL